MNLRTIITAGREILARLLALNHEHYLEKVAQWLHGKQPSKQRAAKRRKRKSPPAATSESRFD